MVCICILCVLTYICNTYISITTYICMYVHVYMAMLHAVHTASMHMYIRMYVHTYVHTPHLYVYLHTKQTCVNPDHHLLYIRTYVNPDVRIPIDHHILFTYDVYVHVYSL